MPDPHGVTRLVPPVEIDLATADGLARQISDAFGSGAAAVVVDFSAVTFCDSTGMRTLVNAAKLSRAVGGSFVIENPTRSLLRLADLLQVSDLLGLPPLGSAG